MAKRRVLWHVLLAVALLLLASWLRTLRHIALPIPEALRITAVFGIYTGIIIAWGVSMRRRIVHRQQRRYLLLSVFVMLFWILLRTLKNYVFIPELPLCRIFWYMYYIALLLLPLLGLFAALWIGRAEDRPPSRWYFLLWLPALALMAGVLTNDLHQRAFWFPGGLEQWTGTYFHGALYYGVVIWTTLLVLAMLITLSRRSRVPAVRVRIWQPLVFVLIGLAYTALYIFVPAINVEFIEVSAMFCALYIGIWESCIQTGLIPSNTRYRELFSASTIGTQIVDQSYTVCYASDRAPELPASLLRRTERAPVLLDENTYLRSMAITGGHALWLDDVGPVSRMLTVLQETQAHLAGRNDLLQAELAIKRSRARVDAQNRLYDQVAREIRPQLNMMEERLQRLSPEDADLRQSVAELCVIGAYVKRRSNLTLLGENEAELPGAELEHCLRESVDYLTVSGVACSFRRTLPDRIATADAKLVYDLFEAAVEAALPTLSALLADLTADPGVLRLKLVCEESAVPLSADWRREALAERGGTLSVQSEGTACYITLALPEGGIV